LIFSFLFFIHFFFFFILFLFKKTKQNKIFFRAEGGYGLVSYFKSDAQSINYYDSESFNFKEGFEDTDFLLRLMRKPLLVVRKKEKDFLHLDHPRAAWKDQTNKGKYKDVLVPPIC